MHLAGVLKYLISVTFILVPFKTGFSQEKNRIIKGTGIFQLKSGLAKMTISNSGARIVSLKLGDTELLTQKTEHENFGSTLWLGPQSNWGWPPYSALDNEKYTGKTNGDSIWLKSRKDKISGFQIEKVFKALDDNSFSVTYILRNISNVPRKVTAWEVTRVPAGGLSFYPSGEIALLPVSNLEGITVTDSITWFNCSLLPFSGEQKLYATGKEGWLAHIHKNILLLKKFKDTKVRELAPEQGEIEIYANGERKYIELENHSAFTELLPGESFQYTVIWYLKQLSEDTKVVQGNLMLLKEVKTLIVKK